MGYLVFFGCLLIAFSPSFAVFMWLIASSPRLVILTIGSSFFWLLSILLASMWWYVIPPLRTIFFWTIPWSVFFQELFRFLFFKLYTKAEKGFIRKNQTTRLTTHPDNFKAALAFGLGSGITHSLVTYIAILWEALGPGSYFSPSCPNLSLFTLSALYSLCFTIYHLLWSLVAFDGFRERNFFKMGAVVACHLVASFLTMLNLVSCIPSIILVFLLLVGFGIYTWRTIMRSTSLRNTRTAVQTIS